MNTHTPTRKRTRMRASTCIGPTQTYAQPHVRMHLRDHVSARTYAPTRACTCGNNYHHSGNISTAVGILSPRWKYSHPGGNIITAVEILSPRWKYYHRGGNISTAVEILFHLIHNFSLDSLQHNLDFIVFTIHIGSSSWFHIVQLFHCEWCEKQACVHVEIAIMTHDFTWNS